MKRLKTLSIVLLVVYFASMYQGAILPFIEGIKYGLSIAKYEDEANIKTQEFLLMDVEPKNAANTIPNEINLKNGQAVLVQATNISVLINDLTEKPIWWMAMNAFYMALTIIVLILGIWIPVLFVKIFRSLQHSWEFEPINLARINNIGQLLIAIGILGSIIQLINILSAEYMVTLSNYQFTYSKVIDFNAIIMGVVILIMNEVMRIAIELKEEQDLTI